MRTDAYTALSALANAAQPAGARVAAASQAPPNAAALQELVVTATEAANLNDFLTRIGLPRWVTSLADQGFTKPITLLALSKADARELGMKLGEWSTLDTALQVNFRSASAAPRPSA